MYQSDRGDYRTKQSLLGMFWNSCLGKLVVFGVAIGILLIIAAITAPSEDYMMSEMTDNLCQHLERPDSILTDQLDDGVYNVGYIFSSSKTQDKRALLATFNRFNRLEYFDHGIYSTTYIFNNYHPEGVRSGIGLFGIVIPTIYRGDIVLEMSSMRKDFNYKPVQDNGEEEYESSMPQFYNPEDLEYEAEDLE